MPNDDNNGDSESNLRDFLKYLKQKWIEREYQHGQKRVDYHRRIKDLSGKLGAANRRVADLEEQLDVLNEQFRHYQTINAETVPKKPRSFRKGLLWGAGIASLLYLAEPLIYDKIIKDIWAYHDKKIQQVNADVSQFTADITKVLEGSQATVEIPETVAKSLRIPDLEGYQVTIDSKSDTY